MVFSQDQQLLPDQLGPEDGQGSPAEANQQIIEQLAEFEQEQQIQHAAENYNLAQKLDDGLNREIAQEIYNGFTDDEETRTDWLKTHEFWLSLYMQQDYAENSDSDRDWGATESLPILTESCDQFQARTYKTFFPQDRFVAASPMRMTAHNRKNLEDRSKRVGDHMSYQLGFKDRSYREDKDALFLGVSVHGSFFTKTYFNDKSKSPKIDNVRPTDLVVNYHVGPVRIENLRRKTHICYKTVGETEDLVKQGFFLVPAQEARYEIGNSGYNCRVDETQGLSAPSSSKVARDAGAVMGEQHFYLDLEGTGEYRPYIGTIDLSSKKLMRLVVGYEADPMGNPLKDYEQVQYFTHYKYKNNPDGFYGLGQGHSIGDLNSAANIMLRQTMDAATLANDGNNSGFIGDSVGIEGDEITLSLGKYKKIPGTMGDLQQNIMQMQFAGPNEALIKLMDAIDMRAQRLGSTTEATTGTPNRAEQPTTYLASIEQALEPFSAVQMRLANALADEFQKIYRLNQRYLPAVDYYIVNGEPAEIAREDYADDMMVQPVFDPKFTTQMQKLARAQSELQAVMQNPVNQGRPEVYDAAFRRFHEAMDTENIDELVPPQPQIENFDDQLTENMFYLLPKEARPLFDVFPEQNHALHLMQLQEFVAQYGQMLQPDQQEDVLKHQQKHMSYLYGQQHGIIEAPPPESIATPPLGARSDIQMGAGATSPVLPPSQAELLSQIVAGSASGGGQPAGPGMPPQTAG